MSVFSRRAIMALRRSPIVLQPRTLSTPPTPTPPQSSDKPALSNKPYTISSPPQFPPPTNPFDGETPQSPATAAAAAETPVAPEPAASAQGTRYSESTKTIVKGVARLMGYNTRASTAIRETGRMMRGIVEAIERDRAFWYDRCALPPTYQTFFQLHLLYVFILLPRIRGLPATSTPTSPVPEPVTSSAPQPTEPVTADTSSSSSILSKPDYEAYQAELLSHFFEMAESQMRRVLGRGERERVVRKYMDEMGEQWRGAGTGLDYVLGLGMSEVAEERAKADAELASWVWRNLFASKGLTPAPPVVPEDGAAVEEVEEIDLVQQVELVVRFVRKEMSRLDGLRDDDVLSGNIGEWASPDQQ